jgi:hypothetical protein
VETAAWWGRVAPEVRHWLIDNNGDALPREIATSITAAGGQATIGEPLADEAVDWIEAVANGETAD